MAVLGLRLLTSVGFGLPDGSPELNWDPLLAYPLCSQLAETMERASLSQGKTGAERRGLGVHEESPTLPRRGLRTLGF